MRKIGLVLAVALVIGALALITYYAQPQPQSGPGAGLFGSGLFGGGRENREALEQGRARIQSQMLNPESATFSDVALYDFNGQKVVCGYVDGTNAEGELVGRQRFMAGAAGAMLEEVAPEDFADAWNTACRTLILRDTN